MVIELNESFRLQNELLWMLAGEESNVSQTGQLSLFLFESVNFVLEISDEFCQCKGGEGSIFTENGFFLMFWALNDLFDLICFFLGFEMIGMSLSSMFVS